MLGRWITWANYLTPHNWKERMQNQVLVDRIHIAKLNDDLKNILCVLAGSLLIAASARMSFYLPFSPVPITGQTFVVLMLAATMGSKRGCAAVIAYIIEGMAGLPFFAGGAFGLAILKGVTFGYLIGFVVAAYWVGKLAERGNDKSFFSALPTFLQGYAVIFLFGVGWLSFFVGFSASIVQGFLFFIPGETIKLALMSFCLPSLWKLTE